MNVPAWLLDPETVRHVSAVVILIGAAAAGLGWKRVGAFAVVLAVCLSLGSRSLMLQRPYALFWGPEESLEAGRIGVAAALRNAEANVLSRAEPVMASPATWLAAHGASPDGIETLFRYLPLVLLVVSALALGRLQGRAQDRPFDAIAACAWLVLSTGDLETLAGQGFVAEVWGHTTASLVLLVEFLVLGTFAGRLVALRRSTLFFVVVLLAAPWFFVARPPGHPDLGIASVLLLLTLDQGLVGAAAGSGWRRGGAASRALCLAGAALLILHAITGRIEPWAGAVLYRAGLVLLAVPVLEHLIGLVADVWSRDRAARGRVAWRRSSLASGLAIFAAAGGSFALWWNPFRLDPLARDSVEPVPQAVSQAATWIRTQTATDAVFVASPGLAPAVAALGRRQVLRAPALLAAPDDHQRRRAERVLLTSCLTGDFPQRYGVTHLLIAPGEFAEYGIASPDDLEKKHCFRGVYAGLSGYRIFEVREPLE